MIRSILSRASLAVAVWASASCGGGDDASRAAPGAGAAPTAAMPVVNAPTPTPTSSVRTPSAIAATGCPATDLTNAALPGTIHNDAIEASETLTLAGSPHRFPDGAWLRPNVTVTIEPCARIIVADGQHFRVGEGANLIANGTADRPILFDSAATVPARGIWGGLSFMTGARPGSTLRYVTVEEGGPTGDGRGGITLEDRVEALLDHVRIVRSARHGLHLYAGARLAAGSDEITVTESGVEHELSGAVYAYEANSVSSIPTVHLEGNVLNEIIVEVGAVSASATFRNPGAGARYRLLDGLRVQGSSGPILTIAPGTVLAFAQGTSLTVGFGEDGALVLDGAADATRIVLTSARPIPGPGDWGGILFGEQLARTATKLAYVTIDYAGGTDANDDGGCHDASPAAITILGADLGAKIDHVRVTNLAPTSVAIARGFASATPTDYSVAALGNELAGGGRCQQTMPRDEAGNCPDPVPACR